MGIQFVSLRDNLDLTTPSGRLLLHIVGAMAEFERSLIQERVLAGSHNPNKPGYSRKGKRLGRRLVNIPTARVQRLRGEGLSWGAIAKATGVAKATLLRRIE